MSTLSAYLERRELGSGERRGDEVVVDLDPRGTGTHRLQASFRPVGPAREFVLIRVRSGQRLPTSVRDEVLTTCNLWNARVRLPRAWFDDSPGAVEGEVVLDGCTPFGAVQAGGLDAVADAVIAGARSFWRWVDVHANW